MPEAGAQDPPGTPPDWGGSDDAAMKGVDGPVEAQPDSIRDDLMTPSSTQEPRIPDASFDEESGAERPASSMIMLKENPDAPPRPCFFKETPEAPRRFSELPKAPARTRKKKKNSGAGIWPHLAVRVDQVQAMQGPRPRVRISKQYNP